MNNMENKRGMVFNQLLALILAIVGFIIVLILLMTLDFGDYSNDETCKLSILSRNINFPGDFDNVIPLKCQTKKICLTDELIGGKCESFTKSDRAERVKVKSDSKEDQLSQVVADEMVRCWNMVGQGKLDLFSGAENPLNYFEQITGALNLNEIQPACIICSRIALDEQLNQETKKNLNDKFNLREYLYKTKISPDTKKTYLEYLTDGQVSSYSSDFIAASVTDPANVQIEKNEIAIVFMQIRTPMDGWTAFTDTAFTEGAFVLGVGGGGAYALGGAKGVWFLARGVGGTAIKHPAVAIGAVGIGLGVAGLAGITQYQNQKVSAGYCGKFTDDDGKAKQGCSVLIPTVYDAKTINTYCKRLEGVQ